MEAHFDYLLMTGFIPQVLSQRFSEGHLWHLMVFKEQVFASVRHQFMRIRCFLGHEDIQTTDFKLKASENAYHKLVNSGFPS